MPNEPSVPGTKSVSSTPSASVVNFNSCTEGLTGIELAVSPPSRPPAVLIKSANSSVGVAGLDGPAFLSTMPGGC